VLKADRVVPASVEEQMTTRSSIRQREFNALLSSATMASGQDQVRNDPLHGRSV
jgi:hypothetical protein